MMSVGEQNKMQELEDEVKTLRRCLVAVSAMALLVVGFGIGVTIL